MKQSDQLLKLRQHIAKEAPFIGVKSYSHNIVGLILSEIAEAYGDAEAEKAILDFKLYRKGWKKPEVS